MDNSGATPDFPEGIYHYHSTWVNGEEDLGFLTSSSVTEALLKLVITTRQGQGGDTDCSGYGETWGLV